MTGSLIVPADPHAEPAVRFAHLETVIRENLESAVAVWEALDEIKRNKLYKLVYGTWDEYCRERWGFARNAADRRIQQYQALKALPASAEPPSQREVARERREQRRAVRARPLHGRPPRVIDAEGEEVEQPLPPPRALPSGHGSRTQQLAIVDTATVRALVRRTHSEIRRQEEALNDSRRVLLELFAALYNRAVAPSPTRPRVLDDGETRVLDAFMADTGLGIERVRQLVTKAKREGLVSDDASVA